MIPIPVRSAIIIDLHDGLSHTAIAARHGVGKNTVARVAEDQGLVAKRGTPADRIRRGSISPSSHRSFNCWFLSLPDDVINWLVSETPKDAKPSDVVKAIVMDAYGEAAE